MCQPVGRNLRNEQWPLRLAEDVCRAPSVYSICSGCVVMVTRLPNRGDLFDGVYALFRCCSWFACVAYYGVPLQQLVL